MNEREKFESWFNSVALCRNDFEGYLFEGWQACAEQKEKEIAALKAQYRSLQLSYDAVWEGRDDAQLDAYECNKELKELRDTITDCWYQSYPESMRTPDIDDKAALQRIFNLYQDLKDTRFNYRVLHKAYNELDAERKK